MVTYDNSICGFSNKFASTDCVENTDDNLITGDKISYYEKIANEGFKEHLNDQTNDVSEKKSRERFCAKLVIIFGDIKMSDEKYCHRISISPILKRYKQRVSFVLISTPRKLMSCGQMKPSIHTNIINFGLNLMIWQRITESLNIHQVNIKEYIIGLIQTLNYNI